MTPEISKRCPSCGAATRDADALFCYECGKPLSIKPKNSEVEAGEVSSPTPVEAEEPPAPETAEVAAPETPDSESAATTSNEPAAAVASKEEPEPAVSIIADESPAAQPAARRGDKTRERLHRASEVARGVTRGVMEEPARRVEKIRQVSTVVIEEASYDPSLRFVLVALALFVIFIILLVLSKVMG